MSDLDTFIKEAEKKSRFLRFEDGIPVVGIYRGARTVDDSFNPGERTLEYTLEVGGVKKTFNSQSVKLARLMKAVKRGDEVELVKTGRGFETQWYVGKVKGK